MRLSTTRLFPLALMFALALLTFYLERTVRDDDSHPAMRRHDPDYLVANFTTTTYNKEGAAYTKRENVHRMADANKAFAHFAW